MTNTTLSLLLGLSLAGAVTKSFDSDVITTRKLVLQDAQGKARGGMSVNEGNAAVFVLGPDGTSGAFMMAQPDGTISVMCKDRRGKPQAVMMMMPDGSSVVTSLSE